jgi:hypothetical protein
MSEWDTTTTNIAPFSLERLFDADIQLANYSSARGSTKWAENLGEESTLVRSVNVGRDRLGAASGAARIPDRPHLKPFRRELRPPKPSSLHFDWCLLTWRWCKRVPLFVSPPDKKAPATGIFRLFLLNNQTLTPNPRHASQAFLLHQTIPPPGDFIIPHPHQLSLSLESRGTPFHSRCSSS